MKYSLWYNWILRNKNLHSLSWHDRYIFVHAHGHILLCREILRNTEYFSTGLIVYNEYWVSVKVEFNAKGNNLTLYH